MPTIDDFQTELLAQIDRARKQGRPHAEINAGELHRALGGYPTKNAKDHSMPTCCNAMRKESERRRAEVVYEPSKGKGASLTIRYFTSG